MPAAKEAELDFVTAYNFTATLAEISNDFKKRLLEGYQKDLAYIWITEVLDANDQIDNADSSLHQDPPPTDSPQSDHGLPKPSIDSD